MSQVLGQLPKNTHPDLLVGIDTSDDAGVFRLDARTALVQTVDFFTPVVDDPHVFGQIAVANALSDVYAMGGRPLTGLNIVGFPIQELPLQVLGAILAGGASKAQEAGLVIVGGHTVDDPEPKYGMAITGLVHPDRIVTNSDARPSDVLILTKPLGSGILTTAMKRDLLDADTSAVVIQVMAALNKAAAEAMTDVGVHACTDITGFGLLGHLMELVKGSNLAASIRMRDIPLMPKLRELAAQDVVPGGSRTNLAYLEPRLRFDPDIAQCDRLILADAQTSGGLLIAVAPEKVDALTAALETRGVLAAHIGVLASTQEGPSIEILC